MSSDTSSARYAYRLRAAARDAGLDADSLCAEAGLSLPAECPPELRLPTERIHRLLGLVVERSGDPAFALRLAAATDLAAFDVLAFAAMTCPTLGDGLRAACRYLALFIDSAAWLLHDGASPARLELVRRGPKRPEHVPAEDLGVGDMVGFIRRATGRAWAPKLVRLRRKAPLDLAPHRELFGAPVLFGQRRTELWLERAALALPMQKAEPAMAAFFQQEAERLLARRRSSAPLPARVQQLFADELRGALPPLESVARRLELTPRTLRRRLQEAGTSYSALLDETRRALAEGHLAEGSLSAKEIAFLLGFSTVSAFTRAFRRWTGLTLARFRGRRSASKDVNTFDK